jgi:hypothetical protein
MERCVSIPLTAYFEGITDGRCPSGLFKIGEKTVRKGLVPYQKQALKKGGEGKPADNPQPQPQQTNKATYKKKKEDACDE